MNVWRRTESILMILGVVSAIAIGIFVMMSPANAQGNRCFPSYTSAVSLLGDEQWRESPVWKGGLTSSEAFIALFLSKDNTTWTIVTRLVNKRACIVASGDTYEFLEVRETFGEDT